MVSALSSPPWVDMRGTSVRRCQGQQRASQGTPTFSLKFPIRIVPQPAPLVAPYPGAPCRGCEVRPGWCGGAEAYLRHPLCPSPPMSEPRTLKAPFGELTVHVRRSLNLLALRTQSNNLCHQDARLFSVLFFFFNF